MTTSTIICPRCQEEMYRMERSGVVLDRCSHCGGVFLDRGELQALIQAETDYNASIVDDFEPIEEEREEEPAQKKASRRGFLEELFDVG